MQNLERIIKFQLFLYIQIIFILLLNATALPAANEVGINLDRAVELAMRNSYRIKQLEMGIERTRFELKATRAGLKTKLYMNLKTPVIEAISEYKWNSLLQRDELVYSNTQLWQMDFTIEQPVILFGFPTNGYLSLNNKMYSYKQRGDANDISYYNRYFIKFEQPFFQPNHLKNDIDEAELELEENELEYREDVVDVIIRTSENYYDVFHYSFINEINKNQLEIIKRTETIVNEIVSRNPSRSFEKDLLQVELANSNESSLQNLSDMKMKILKFKRQLGLNGHDSIIVPTKIKVRPINVELGEALEYGFRFHPEIKLLQNRRKQKEINLSNTKGKNSFRIDLEMTYGLEKQDEYYGHLWQENENSYSVALNAYIPIWDWGQRKARIEASKISIRKTDLYMEEFEESIQAEIKNAIINLNEYQERVLKMNDNVKMAKEITSHSINQYKNNQISLQDLFQTINRLEDTERNFLRAYLGYRRSLLHLMLLTHYDFENEINIFDKYAYK